MSTAGPSYQGNSRSQQQAGQQVVRSGGPEVSTAALAADLLHEVAGEPVRFLHVRQPAQRVPPPRLLGMHDAVRVEYPHPLTRAPLPHADVAAHRSALFDVATTAPGASRIVGTGARSSSRSVAPSAPPGCPPTTPAAAGRAAAAPRCTPTSCGCSNLRSRSRSDGRTSHHTRGVSASTSAARANDGTGSAGSPRREPAPAGRSDRRSYEHGQKASSPPHHGDARGDGGRSRQS